MKILPRKATARRSSKSPSRPFTDHLFHPRRMLVDARVPGATVATGYGSRMKTARTISIEDGCRLRDDIEGTSRGKESRGEP